MDADDVSEPRRLERQIAYLDHRPDIGVLGTWVTLIDQYNRRIGCLLHPRGDAAIRQHLQIGSALVHPSVLVRTRLLRDAGGYRPAFKLASDYDLWLRLADRTRFANVPDALLRYRFHPGQVTVARLIEQVHYRVAARVSADLRSAGHSDPFSLPLDEPIDVVLKAHGVEDDVLRGLIVTELAGRATLFAAAGDRSFAWRYLRQAEHVAAGGPVARSVRARLAIQRARLHLVVGQLRSAAASMVRAAALDPTQAARTASRAVGGGRLVRTLRRY
jgi:hypothetical protein